MAIMEATSSARKSFSLTSNDVTQVPAPHSPARSTFWFYGKPKSSKTKLAPTAPKSAADYKHEAEINKDMVRTLEGYLTEMEQDLDDTTAVLEGKELELAVQRTANDKLQARIVQLNDELADARNKLKAKSDDHSATKDNLEARINDLEDQLSQAQAELEDLEQLLAKQEHIEEELVFEQHANMDLQTKLLEKTDQFNAAELTTRNLQDKLDEANKKVRNCEVRSNCTAGLKRSLNATKREVEELEKQLAAQHTSTTKAFTEDTAALRHQLKERSDQVTKLQQQIQTQDQELKKRDQDIEKRNKLLTTFQTTTTNAHATFIQVQSARKELEQAKKVSDDRVRSLQFENDELARQVSDAERKLATSEQERIAEREAVMTKLHAVNVNHQNVSAGHKDTIRVKDRKIQEVEHELENLGKAASTAEANHTAQITNLQGDLARQNLLLEDERAKVIQSYDWADQKAADNADIQKANQDLTTRVSDVEKASQQQKGTENPTLLETNKALKKRIDLLEGGQFVLRRAKKNLEDKVSTLEDENNDLRKLNLQHEDNEWLLRADRTDLVDHNNALAYHLYDRNAQIGNLLEQNAYYHSTAAALHEQNQQQAGLFEALQREQVNNAYLRSMVRKLREQAAESTDTQQVDTAHDVDHDIWMEMAESDPLVRRRRSFSGPGVKCETPVRPNTA